MGLATLSGGPMTVGIDVLKTVTLLTWSSHDFRDIAASDPPLALDLLDRSVYAIQALNRLIKLRTFAPAASRLAGLLLQYESFCFARDAPLVPRRQLADLAGVSPRMVSKILRKWEATAIVRRVGAAELELLDRTALEAEAADLADFPPPDRSMRGAWSAPELERT
jgi:CRP-like cAMP-binding protein